MEAAVKTFAVLAVFVCFCWSCADCQSTIGPISTSKASPTQALNSHNEYRRLQNASDMIMLSWDDQLATEAQTYAEDCTFAHDGTIDVGENIFFRVGGPAETYLAAITSWYNEIEDYDYATGACAIAKVCGHYTQVVWAKSEKLGCGAAHCPTIVVNDGAWNDAELVVCRYSPAGNFNSQKPFTKGTPCTNCPTGWSCNKELCQDPSTVSSTASTITTSESTTLTTASTSSTTQGTSTTTATEVQESTITTAFASSPPTTPSINSGTMSTSESTTIGSTTIPTTTETTNICDLSPNRTPFLHPDDTGKCVHRFYQCDNGELREQTCGDIRRFNPAFGGCDWENKIPACMTTVATTTATTKSETDTTTTKFPTTASVFTTSQDGSGGTTTSSSTIGTTATTEMPGTTPTGSTTSTPQNGCSAEKAAILREYQETFGDWVTTLESWRKDFESGTHC